jgi:DNA invertase Pin-like site-specific DNA recombinase
MNRNREPHTHAMKSSAWCKNVRSQRRLIPNRVDELIAAYGAGAPINELARAFAIHRTTVMAHIKHRGVGKRNR